MKKPFVQVPLHAFEMIIGFLNEADGHFEEGVQTAAKAGYISGEEEMLRLLAGCKASKAELEAAHESRGLI